MSQKNLHYAGMIGSKLRDARQQQRMSLRDLAQKASISASMLPQASSTNRSARWLRAKGAIKNGQATAPTLQEKFSRLSADAWRSEWTAATSRLQAGMVMPNPTPQAETAASPAGSKNAVRGVPSQIVSTVRCQARAR